MIGSLCRQPAQSQSDGRPAMGRSAVEEWAARDSNPEPIRRRDGSPTATTHGPRPASAAPAIPEPEGPRRRRSNRDPATAASSPTGPACGPLRRAGSWPRGPAGCRPTTPRSTPLSFSGGPPGSPLPAPARQASGVTAAERQRHGRRAPRRRRVRPVQGRLDRCTESSPTPVGSRQRACPPSIDMRWPWPSPQLICNTAR